MKQKELFLQLLKAGIQDVDFNILPDKNTDWDDLLDQAAEHGLVGWMWSAITKLPKECQPPRQQLINWGLSAEDVADAYCRQKSAIKKLVSLCDNNSIRVLLLKGEGLSYLYPKPEYRFSSDIDIFLFGDYEKGNKVLADDKYDFGGRHSMFVFDGENVENHVTLIHTTTKIQKKVEHFLESSLDQAILTPQGYYILEPYANIVFLLMHSLSHMDSVWALTIKNVVDFYMSLKTYADRQAIRPKKLLSIVDDLNMGDAFELMLSLSERFLSDTFSEYHNHIIPEEDIEKAEQIIDGRISLPPYSPQMSLIKRLKLRKERHSQIRWVYRYSPRKIQDRILAGFRHEVSFELQRLLGMKSGVGLREEIRHRINGE